MHRSRHSARILVRGLSTSNTPIVNSGPRPVLTPKVLPIKSFSTAIRRDAAVQANTASRTQHAAPPEMSSSLDQIIPKTIFDQYSSSTEDGAAPIPEPLARQTVEIILTQLRQGVDATSHTEVLRLSKEADEKVIKILKESSISAASLHHFVTRMLRLSKDPRRMPIAFRLFGIAFGVDPLELKDPTAPTSSTSGLDSTLSSVPIAGKDAWGINAAGYNWASMVLSGQSPPPSGIHLLKKGSKEYIEAISKQQGAAVRIYATLAMRGDAQGMLGMGRVLMAGTQRENPVPGKSGADVEKEVQLMKERTIALWTKAGQLGVGDAWFELGLLYLGNVKGMSTDDAKARSYFEMGAKESNMRCHHALGVMHTQAAMSDNRSPSPPERQDNLSKSLEHFTSAAQLGDPQSAHNLGLRFLLRDEMIDEIALGKEQDGRTDEEVIKQARKRHESLWGVEADDIEARKWFERAAEYGSIPAMMNFAGMLVEARGRSSPSTDPSSVTSQEEAAKAILISRLEELKRAESLYSRVAAHGNVMQQQQPSSGAPSQKNANVDQAKGNQEIDVAKEMTTFAQSALGTVQSMITQLVEEVDKIHKGPPQSTNAT